VSVLTPLRPTPVAEIEVGRHGVLLRKDGRTAVFLPKVATEQGWSRDETLDHLCLKAGLPRGGWHRDAALFTFEADAFGDAGRE
jgi:AMMECR1 domain-containing protein